MVTIIQGESQPIYIDLYQDDRILTPDMIQDLTICIGDSFSASYLAGGVQFRQETSQWCIWPTKAETQAITPGKHWIYAHVRYADDSEPIFKLDIISVEKHRCGGVHL